MHGPARSEEPQAAGAKREPVGFRGPADGEHAPAQEPGDRGLDLYCEENLP